MHKQSRFIGSLIRLRRIERGLTQRQLADLTNGAFREHDVQLLESGRYGHVRPDRLERLLYALNVDLATLHGSVAIDGTFDGRSSRVTSVGNQWWTASVVELVSARERLQLAMHESRRTRQRTTEILLKSQQLIQLIEPANTYTQGRAEPSNA